MALRCVRTDEVVGCLVVVADGLVQLLELLLPLLPQVEEVVVVSH